MTPNRKPCLASAPCTHHEAALIAGESLPVPLQLFRKKLQKGDGKKVVKGTSTLAL